MNARAELARKTIVIGDQIYLDINISAPPGTTVYPIDGNTVNELPGAEVIKDGELTKMADEPELLFEQRFLITSFDTGYVTIPALPLFFETSAGVQDTAYTNDLLLTVKGANVSAEEDILPIKPIIAEPRNWVDYWPVYLLMLAVAGFFRLPRLPPPPNRHRTRAPATSPR